MCAYFMFNVSLTLSTIPPAFPPLPVFEFASSSTPALAERVGSRVWLSLGWSWVKLAECTTNGQRVRVRTRCSSISAP